MAREGITFEQVAAAADALVGQGVSPTIRAVRESLGTGSPNTIHRHLVAWREARPAATAAAPELPAPLMAALAAEIERAAATARAEVESRLVQTQSEAADLAAAGEALEAERDALLEQVAALTTQRDQAHATAVERAAEIARAIEQIEREQRTAESARVELAKAQLKLESQDAKVSEQTKELERLRTALEASQTARIAAEQAVAVAGARSEALVDRATRAEERIQGLEKQAQQVAQELSSARVQVQAQQTALDGAVREIEAAKRQVEESRAQAKKAGEEAAELRGRLAAAAAVPGKG